MQTNPTRKHPHTTPPPPETKGPKRPRLTGNRTGRPELNENRRAFGTSIRAETYALLLDEQHRLKRAGVRVQVGTSSRFVHMGDLVDQAVEVLLATGLYELAEEAGPLCQRHVRHLTLLV